MILTTSLLLILFPAGRGSKTQLDFLPFHRIKLKHRRQKRGEQDASAGNPGHEDKLLVQGHQLQGDPGQVSERNPAAILRGGDLGGRWGGKRCPILGSQVDAKELRALKYVNDQELSGIRVEAGRTQPVKPAGQAGWVGRQKRPNNLFSQSSLIIQCLENYKL